MRTLLLSLLLCGLVFSWTALPGQNNALHFDGDGDYITLSPVNGFPIGPVSDFTVEMWFISEATGSTAGDCVSDFRRLFALGIANNSTLFEVGECNGFLSVFWFTGVAANLLQMTSSIRDNQWHCLSVVRSATNLDVFLDGILVLNDPTITGTQNASIFSVGHGLALAGPSPGQDWMGGIDEVKLWNIALPLAQLTACSNCVLTGAEPGLVAYWQLDQGIASGNNTGITQALDASFLGNNSGTLHPSTATPDPGFDLMGSDGNFVSSGAPLVYPNYNNLSVFISDPIQMVGIPWVCNGDATHFSLIDINGNVPAAAGGVGVDWYYSDDLWVTSTQIPSLNGFQFGVPANTATAINCPTLTGYVDREFRALVTVTNSNGTCTYTSLPGGLRIYCEVTQANVQVNSIPAAPLCEGDQATFNVSIITNLPPPGPTNDVHIDWEFSVDGGNNWTQLVQFFDQTGFTYPPVGTHTVGTMDICFKAIVSNLGCGSLTGQTCIQVDPNPVCGSIIGWHTPANLTLIASTPWLTYEICPGEDASVGIDPSLPPFQNCNRQWQYSFTPSIPASWVNMGFSNSLQNTNILPTANWGSNTSIFYRIECQPLSTPSGCDPCYSNIIEIRIKPQPPVPVIIAIPPNQKICKGDIVTLYSSNDPGTQTTWYCNGEVIGTGPIVSVSDQACYWSEATDGCYTFRSDTLCLTVCTAVAIITCPTDNPCIIPNIPITLSGLSSFSVNCGPIVQYDWEVEFLPNGPSYFFTGPTITFTPPLAGVIVYLTVTDSNGCTHSVQTSFEPCQP